jgi:hypothetical protein
MINFFFLSGFSFGGRDFFSLRFADLSSSPFSSLSSLSSSSSEEFSCFSPSIGLGFSKTYGSVVGFCSVGF